jgi:hypothetical protein
MTDSATKRGRKKNCRNYTQVEVDALLDLVEELEPICEMEWDEVARGLADEDDNALRNSQSVKVKFYTYANAKPKTGDPRCPPNVMRAKNINKDLLRKAEAMTGEEPVNVNLAASESGSDAVSGDDAESEDETTRAAVARRQPETLRLVEPPNDSSLRIRRRQNTESQSLLKDVAVLQMEKRQKISEDAMQVQQTQFQQQMQLQMKQMEMQSKQSDRQFMMMMMMMTGKKVPAVEEVQEEEE